METIMKIIIKSSGLILAAILFTLFINLAQLYAMDSKDGQRPFPFMEQLNDVQKEEIKTMIADMKEDGADRNEIREAVKQKLLEYGIELPERSERYGRRGPFGPGLDMVADQLTEEQKTAIKEKIDSMREEGADRKEIREEVRKMLETYGVDLSEQDYRGNRGHRGKRWEFLAKDLSEEQKTAINDKIATMRKEGTDRTEIRDEIRRMLEGYGVNVPESFGDKPPRGMRHGWRHFGADLSDEQKSAIKEKVKSLRESDASREEIHTAVTQMLKDYGIEIPEDLEKHRAMMKNLSKDQRKEVRKIVRTMRKDGASSEKIHETVQQLLKDYGIDPKNPEEDSNSDLNNSEKGLSIQNFPNPFNPETNIQYTLQSDGEVNIQIFDVQGKKVRSLLNQYQSAGTHTALWDGLSESGNHVPSGIYFLRLSAGSETVSKRIVMTK